jgi:hypothetical protein
METLTRETLKFDLTTQEGLMSTQSELTHLTKQLEAAKILNGISYSIDINEIFKDLFNMIGEFVNRFFDLFDENKRLLKQMEIAKQVIEVARAAGAKSVDITINSKNKGNLEMFVEQIDGTITGAFEKDNTITFHIVF